MRTLTLGILGTLAALWGACNEGGGARPIGASCTDGAECASGLCGGGECLDPEADADADSLVNRVEGALGTDLVRGDSDGDGKDDWGEVNDLATPRDSDGDGKIDAVESATADADGDCLPDETDPRDGYSDPPSDAAPGACGTGEVRCDVNPLAGSCAAPLGEMLASCFRPSGACVATAPTQTTTTMTLTWDNGASITWTLGGKVGTGQLRGPTGALCATIVVRDPEGPAPVTTVRVAPAGPQYLMHTDEASEVTTLECPNGGRIALSAEASDAFGQCAGDTSTGTCTYEAPGSCATDADCSNPEYPRCCPLPGETPQRMCLPVEVCPDLSAAPSE